MKCYLAEEYKRSAMERFEELFEPTTECGCWVWLGCHGKKGYGKFWYDGGVKTAHRISYELYVGEIENGLHILHSCDNTACVNPAHLKQGTNTQNHKEKMDRGRNVSPRGEKSGCSKLSNDQVAAINTRLNRNDTCKAIANDFLVTIATIRAIKYGVNWAWLTGRKRKYA